ncbi:MAG: bifunctional 3,4-dihydroxy-2-butanone-4-phosphate synthase/GTP cyclohydrolase II [Bacteroidota bacterium]
MAPEPEKPAFEPVDAALDDIRAGKILIVVDDDARENEGDFVCAAEFVTPDIVNFLARYGRGIICAPLEAARAAELGLGPMVETNTSLHETPFTVSVDYVHGTTTGVSAADRAATIRALARPGTRSADLARPGHVFPLRAMEGGVLRRAGHTEAAVDLFRLAGVYPAGVLCEIMNDDGTMARVPDLVELARRFGLQMITVGDLIEYRLKREHLVTRLVETRLPTRYGEFRLLLYRSEADGKEHLALVKGDVAPGKTILVRVHSECLTGDVFGSLRCDCNEQLLSALRMVERAGAGVVLYMRQEGRGIGLANKLRAYRLQDEGLDTVEANEKLGFRADLRDYGIGAQILRDLGVTRMALLTNNPKKIVGLSAFGIAMEERVPLETNPNSVNHRYLETKRDKLGHLILVDPERKAE